jgi:hypothetical protein
MPNPNPATIPESGQIRCSEIVHIYILLVGMIVGACGGFIAALMMIGRAIPNAR